MKIGMLIGLLVLLSAPVFALEISEYHATAYVVDGRLQEEVTFEISNNQEESLAKFTYPFGGRLLNITVHDSRGELVYRSKYTGEKTYVESTLRQPLPTGESYIITYKFYFDGQITRKEGTYILSTSHSLLANVKNFDFTITLPEGYGVVGQSVSPVPEDIMSDGRRVILKWDINEPIPASLREFKVIVLYENLLSGSHWWESRMEYIYTAIIAGILIAFVYFFRRLRKKQANEKIEILKEDEQAIMRLIIGKDGIDQRDIQRETDFSKTKVSKILSELEKRDVIRKEQVGRRNKIFLTKKLREL
ncbi:MAG: winged helix-turn-helix transcriptional regulator [Candidatus Hydrothermarchaeaceae archaeon]